MRDISGPVERQHGTDCACGHCIVRREMRREDEYFDAVDELLNLLADIIIEYPSIWSRCDDKGGYISMTLANALEQRGMKPSGWEVWQPRPEVLRLAERDGWGCAYCGVTLDGCPDRPRPQVDHVMPKSRGGSNHLSNKVLACGSCNASKNAKTPEEWQAWKEAQK